MLQVSLLAQFLLEVFTCFSPSLLLPDMLFDCAVALLHFLPWPALFANPCSLEACYIARTLNIARILQIFDTLISHLW